MEEVSFARKQINCFCCSEIKIKNYKIKKTNEKFNLFLFSKSLNNGQ